MPPQLPVQGPKQYSSPFGQLPGSEQLVPVFRRPSTVLLEAAIVTVACSLFAVRTVQMDPIYANALTQAEDIIQGIFIVEYLLRWYSRNCRPSYLLKWEMVVDFVAFLPLLFSLAGLGSGNGFEFLRLLRILRIQRFLRDRESFAQLVGLDSADAVQPFVLQLARTVGSISTLVFISSGLMYNAEHETNPHFSNFFVSLYFGLVTLTTVGFGDIVPITAEGRGVVCLSILVGVALIPLELSRLAEAFMDSMAKTSSSDVKTQLQALEHKIDGQQAQLDAIMAKLKGDTAPPNGGGPAAAMGETATANTPRPLAAAGPLPSARCTQCGTAGHRADAVFCYRCGGSLVVAKAARAWDIEDA